MHLIDGTETEIVAAYRTIRAELSSYGHGLEHKPEILILNKADAILTDALSRRRRALEKASGRQVYVMSGVSGRGVDEVLRTIAREVNSLRAGEKPAPEQQQSWAP